MKESIYNQKWTAVAATNDKKMTAKSVKFVLGYYKNGTATPATALQLAHNGGHFGEGLGYTEDITVVGAEVVRPMSAYRAALAAAKAADRFEGRPSGLVADLVTDERLIVLGRTTDSLKSEAATARAAKRRADEAADFANGVLAVLLNLDEADKASRSAEIVRAKKAAAEASEAAEKAAEEAAEKADKAKKAKAIEDEASINWVLAYTHFDWNEATVAEKAEAAAAITEAAKAAERSALERQNLAEATEAAKKAAKLAEAGAKPIGEVRKAKAKAA